MRPCSLQDEGDIDMFELAETLYDAGYKYMLMPDHAPTHPDDKSPEGSSGRVKQVSSSFDLLNRSRSLDLGSLLLNQSNLS